MAFCGDCGKEVQDGVKFCGSCGAPTTGDAAGASAVSNLVGNAHGSEVNGAAAGVENLSLFGYFIKCLKHYAVFEGRARRKEFLGFMLFYWVLYIALMIILLKIVDMGTLALTGYIWVGLAPYIFPLAFALPNLAVSVRRLHDVGKSGWMILLFGIPLIGLYPLILMAFKDSWRGENDYGPSPKYPDDAPPEPINGQEAARAVRSESVKTTPRWKIPAAVGGGILLLAVIAAIVLNGGGGGKYETGSFTDSRDGKKYKTVTIGEQVWMAENLNYAAEGSVCYGEGGEVDDYDSSVKTRLSDAEIQANCEKYGRLYNWETALTACPIGWHLPSDAEWTTLTDFVGGEMTAGKKLKSRAGWNKNGNGTNKYGFSALPGGIAYVGYDGDVSFNYADKYGYWWSATEYDASGAWHRSMGDDYPVDGVGRSRAGGKDALYSVRCLEGGNTASAQTAVPAQESDRDSVQSAVPAQQDNIEEASAKAKMAEAVKVIASFESAYLAAVAEDEYDVGIEIDDLVFTSPKGSKLFKYVFLVNDDDVVGYKATALSDIGGFTEGNFLRTTYRANDGSFTHCVGGSNADVVVSVAKDLAPSFFRGGGTGVCQSNTAPAQQNKAGSSGRIDNRLVNANGETWTHYSSGWFGDNILIFRSNGRFDRKLTLRFRTDDDKFDTVTKTVHGTWHTDENKIIMISDGGETTIWPYTVITNNSFIVDDGNEHEFTREKIDQ